MELKSNVLVRGMHHEERPVDFESLLSVVLHAFAWEGGV